MYAYCFFVQRGVEALNRLLMSVLLIVGFGGLLVLFVDTLPLNILTFLLVALTTLTITLVSIYHLQKGYAPARPFVIAMIVFNLGNLVILPAMLWLTTIAAQTLIIAVMGMFCLCGLLMSIALSERHRSITEDNFSISRELAASTAEINAKAEFLAKISHEIRSPHERCARHDRVAAGHPVIGQTTRLRADDS